jgi:hypothetical protein
MVAATVMVALPVPDAGVAVSQLPPPPVVVAETVQALADDPDGMVSCNVCAAGSVVPGAVKVNCDGVTDGALALVTVSVTGIAIGATVLPVPVKVTVTVPV